MNLLDFTSSDLTTCFIVFVLTLLVIKIIQNEWRGLKRSPPGPWGFPLLGHLPLLGKNPAKTLTEYSKTYGDVFKIRMGSWPTVILNSKDAIHEALMDNSEVFSDRPEFFTAKTIDSEMKSLAFGKFTPRWRLHKKIANHVLRQNASTKNNFVNDLIDKEAQNLIARFLKRKGEIFNPNEDIFIAVGSIIFQLCFGDTRSCLEDEQFLHFIRNTKTFIQQAGAGNPLDVLPWLRFVMPWKVKKFQENVGLNKSIVASEIEKHAQTFDNDNLRDITDGLYSAAQVYGTQDNEVGIRTREIMSTLQDFMGAGFETVSTSIEWILLYLSFYTDEQKLVQKEIDRVLGSRNPTLKDRNNMPYTEATILEVIRLANVVPMGLPHATTKDVIFRNYEIKKGTVVFSNNYATARDEGLWENAEKFCPSRFLDNNNELVREKVESVLTFGLGRRRCPGEFLARMELFLFTTNIFQRFNISLCTEPNFEGIFGLSCKPVPYKIKIEERS